MAYCRSDHESDVYLYKTFVEGSPVWVCHVPVTERHSARTLTAETPGSMADQLETLRDEEPLTIPDRTIRRLRSEEAARNGQRN